MIDVTSVTLACAGRQPPERAPRRTACPQAGRAFTAQHKYLTRGLVPGMIVCDGPIGHTAGGNTMTLVRARNLESRDLIIPDGLFVLRTATTDRITRLELWDSRSRRKYRDVPSDSLCEVLRLPRSVLDDHTDLPGEGRRKSPHGRV